MVPMGNNRTPRASPHKGRTTLPRRGAGALPRRQGEGGARVTDASDDSPEPEQLARERRRQNSATTWWRWMRVGLALVEILAGVRANVALAAGARAIVLLGDEVLGADNH